MNIPDILFCTSCEMPNKIIGGERRSNCRFCSKPLTMDMSETINDAEKDKSEKGLCLMYLDSSRSMNQKSSPNSDKSKIEILCKNVSQAIFDQKNMTQKNNAMIMIRSFNKSENIIYDGTIGSITDDNETNTPEKLEEFISKKVYEHCLSDEGLQTNLNIPLSSGVEIYNSFKKGKIGSYSNFIPKEDSIRGVGIKNKKYFNFRLFIFSDGFHVSDEILKIGNNPFLGDDQNLILGAYFNSFSDDVSDLDVAQAENELKSMVGDCPKHNIKNFFSVTEKGSISLRNLFKMASGSSGFCPNCLPINKDL